MLVVPPTCAFAPSAPVLYTGRNAGKPLNRAAYIYLRLDRDFYDPPVATLTPAEQDLLLASASCPYPPLRSADLNEASDKTPGNVNVLLGRLVEAGILYRIRKGEYAYTAPKLLDYLRRRDHS